MLKALKSLPISVKLMATTTLLLLFTVGLYGVMNLRDLSAAYDEARLDQQQMLERSVAVDARNVTGAIARTSEVLISGTAYGDLKALLAKLQAGDERLLFVQVREGGKTVAEVGDIAAATAGLEAMPDKAPEGDGPGEASILGKGGEPQLLRITVPFGDEGLSGQVDAGWSIADIAERTRRIEQRIDERKRLATINALFVGGMIVLLGVVLTILQSLRISRPVRELTESVERIAHGDLSERAVVDSTDEIGVLGR
ncbi:MAG: HAMP domain-containing protein, partial [Myxococcales bacterium]|nr:HAMP domain-containing protein [Myxococcales bacterium]